MTQKLLAVAPDPAVFVNIIIKAMGGERLMRRGI